MRIAGQLLVTKDDGRCEIKPGTIHVRDHVIESIDWDDDLESAATAVDFGGPQHFISPGFTDAHLHLPQFDIIGAHGLPLLKWLDEVVFPSEIAWQDPAYARGMASRVADQLLSYGTTSVAAYATVHHDATIAAIEVLTERGMRGLVGQVLMDREAPSELCKTANQLIDEANELQLRYDSVDSVRAAITPRFAISCSEELLHEAGRLANDHQAYVQTHLAETRRECARVKELFDRRDYVDVYQDAGLLSDRSLLGHGIHLSPDDRAKLAANDSVIAHCPLANSFLGSGEMNRCRLLNDSVRIGLGSDIGAGYERSMVRVARAMIEMAALSKRQGRSQSVPDAEQAWCAITAGNADLIGLSDGGRIEEGSVADLVVCRPDIGWQSSTVDPLSMLMFAWDDRWIQHVIVRGVASHPRGESK